MDSVFQELKRAREARRLSIDDVSDATLINTHFLEAIEQGNTNILPQPYVRAFIREYAGFVGLDPAVIMKRYDQMKNAPSIPPEADTPVVVQPASPPEEKKTERSAADSPRPFAPTIARFALPAILVLTLAVVVWNLIRTKTPSVREETLFENTIQETLVDSAAKQTVVERQPVTRTQSDSLTLHATITDTVWVQIVIDNQEPQQYIFRPGRKITWRARENFRLSAGSAGAIDLLLDDKHLGLVGKRGAVVRNLDFNRQTLRQK